MKHVSPWECPGTAHTSSRTFPIAQQRAYTTGGCPTAQRGCPVALGVPYTPGDGPTVPTVYPDFRNSIPIGTLCTQQTHMLQEGFSQQARKNKQTANSEQ